MNDVFQENAPSKSIVVFIRDSTTFLGKTGLAYNTASFKAYYCRQGAAPVEITLVNQTVIGAWTTGGFKELEPTFMPGSYRFDVPNEVHADGVEQAVIQFTGTGVFHEPHIITIVQYDPLQPDPDIATILAATVTEIADIKAKTDQLTFTTSNKVDTDAKSVADAIKVKTDQLTFSVANKVNTDAKANVDLIKAKTDQLTFTTSNKVDAKLTADGMDNVPGYVP